MYQNRRPVRHDDCCDIDIKHLHPHGIISGLPGKNGYSPYVNEETGTWFEFDDESQTYVDTGVLVSTDAILSITHEQIDYICDKYFADAEDTPAEGEEAADGE